MPDQRAHRGPAPGDRELFDGEAQPRLAAAVGDLSWLLARGYPLDAALALVGDRFQLRARQRVAVRRCAAAEAALAARRAREVGPEAVRGAILWLDGFNVLTTVEVALSGGLVLRGRDGCLRDLASLSGTWRRVTETLPAIGHVGATLSALAPARSVWLLDRPVSNSGRLRALLEAAAAESGWPWEAKLAASPDRELAATDGIVATADHVVLDRCGRWFNLAGAVVQGAAPDAWVVDLG